MAFDVELRDPGTGFDIALAATGTGPDVSVPGASYAPLPIVEDGAAELVLLTLLLA